MADKGDGFGLPEESLRQLVDEFQRIAKIFGKALEAKKTFNSIPEDASIAGGSGTADPKSALSADL